MKGVNTMFEDMRDVFKKVIILAREKRGIQKTSDDFSTLSDVVEEVLEQYKTKGINYELGCCILPTCPLLQEKYLNKGLNLLTKNNHSSTMPIVRFSFPIQRALYLNEDGSVFFIDEKHKRTRSQDLRPAFHDAGQFYWFYTAKGLSSDKRGGFEISELEAQDVDTEEDWAMAEIKHRIINENALIRKTGQGE